MPNYLILAQYAVCEDPVGPGQSLSISNTCCEEFQINLDFCEEDFSSLGFRYVQGVSKVLERWVWHLN